MLGSVTYITPNMNAQPWDLEMSGLEFEDHISTMIEYALFPYFKDGLAIERTPSTRDDGKDLVITSPVSFRLFGKYFPVCDKNNVCLYVEFKSSATLKKIQLDKFSKNILLANHSQLDHFVLITNTTVSPFAYHEACRNATENGYEFFLVDQYKLASFLNRHDALPGTYEKPDETQLSVYYQLNHIRLEGKPYLELYLFFRNNTDMPRICRFQLRTDRNWQLTNTEFEMLLEAGESECRCIGIKKEHFDGIDDILIDLYLEDDRQTVVINGASVDYAFETPLIGEKHKQLIRDLVNCVLENTSIRLFHLRGEAGIGKTRVIHEATKELERKGTQLLYFTCPDNCTNPTIDDLVNYLQEKFPNEKISSYKDLLRIPMHFKKYAIVLEDVHHADRSLFTAIKELYGAKGETPFTLIIAGRDDSTVYNASYFAFLSWLDTLPKDARIDHLVEKLTDQECRRMILAVIREAPEVVVTRIQEASENNPFYVCQFIEYLLETKLTYLVNRNTVGINNVSSFAQKLYIPKCVEALLARRFALLAEYPDGAKLQQFLLLLGFYGIEAPEKIYYEFFSGAEYANALALYTKHFIKLTAEGHITFDHESIYLFIKNKLQSKKARTFITNILFKNKELLAVYPKAQRAVVSFQAGELAECEVLLKVPIEEIRILNNISSCNLTPCYFDIYSVIYDLAKKKKDTLLQRNTLLATLYVALHNLSVAKGGLVIPKVIETIEVDCPNDISLKLTAKQMQAHLLLQTEQISQAKKILLELAAQERKNPELFGAETRFDLFDRLSSVFTQENHRELAQLYNSLSFSVAAEKSDKKLETLSTIISAKIRFLSDTKGARQQMLKARQLLEQDMAYRINCHNEFGILTADILLGYATLDNGKLQCLYDRGAALLEQATQLEYPEAILRGNYLLAVLQYLSPSVEACEKAELHIDAAITNSIRNGISKMMPLLYCLKALIAARKQAPAKQIYPYFQTMLQHMRQRDQLFLGALDLTSHNVILLTNYAIFLCEYGLESEVYQFLGEIRFYGSSVTCDYKCAPERDCFYVCNRNIDVFRKNYKAIGQGELLFVGKKHKYPLRDTYTPFYIPLGV